MEKTEDILESLIRDKMKGHSLVVAVIPEEPCDYDKEKADLIFKPLIKRKVREQQLEILICAHPTVYWINNFGIKCFVFGVTEDLKNNKNYFRRFLKACQGDNTPVFIGIRKTYLY